MIVISCRTVDAGEAAGQRFSSEAPVPLFTIPTDLVDFHPYDVTADGQRFVVATRVTGDVNLPTVVVNWVGLLEKAGR